MPDRIVYLKPNHSSWWLLSPGITLYYDRVVILKKDYENFLMEGGLSSYNEKVATHLEALIKEGSSEIEVVPDLPIDKSLYEDIGKELADDLFAIALDPNNLAIQFADILDLQIGAYEDWINHNKRKLYFLREDEKQAKTLRTQRIPTWTKRIDTLKAIKAGDESVYLEKYHEDSQLLESFRALIQAAYECVVMADNGLNIYDPMLPEYMPVISLLEGIRADPAGENPSGVPTMISSYRRRMSLYLQKPEIDYDLGSFFFLIERYRQVRKRLLQLDETLAEIDETDIEMAFQEARKEILPIVREIRKIEGAIDLGKWALWAVSFHNVIAAAFANPLTINKVKEIATALSFIGNRVGAFAGTYAMVADGVIKSQRMYKKISYLPNFDEDDKYWDSGKDSDS